jgi:putative oxidoreductase
MNMAFLARFTEPAYALLRACSGLLFAFHGLQKTFGAFTEKHTVLFSQGGLGGVIELVAGVLIALGLFTRPAAFLSSGTMLVAYTQFHWKLQLGAQFFPPVNKGELALVYCVLFLYMACRGAGTFGLDARLRAGSRG